jgi:hypothetical protein
MQTTTTVNTLATKYKLSHQLVEKALAAADITPIGELPIGKRAYKLYEVDTAERAIAVKAAEEMKKRAQRQDKRLKKLRASIGAPTVPDSRLDVIEAKLDALIAAVDKLNESSLAGVEFA